MPFSHLSLETKKCLTILERYSEKFSYYELVGNKSLCIFGVALDVFISRTHKSHILLFCGEKEFCDL